MLERKLQNYLIANTGRNLSRIDSELVFLDSEYSFKGGRIDILAAKNGLPVAIELKANNYSSSQVAGQLINYHNFLESKSGFVYFVAPKVKPGVFSTLKNFERLRFFEFDEKLNFYEINKSDSKKKFFSFVIPEIEKDITYTYFKAPVAKVLSKSIKYFLGF